MLIHLLQLAKIKFFYEFATKFALLFRKSLKNGSGDKNRERQKGHLIYSKNIPTDRNKNLIGVENKTRPLFARMGAIFPTRWPSERCLRHSEGLFLPQNSAYIIGYQRYKQIEKLYKIIGKENCNLHNAPHDHYKTQKRGSFSFIGHQGDTKIHFFVVSSQMEIIYKYKEL